MGTVIQDTYTGALANLTAHSPDVNVPTGAYVDFNFVPALRISGAGVATAVAAHGAFIQGDVLQNTTGISDYSASIDVIVPDHIAAGTYIMAAGVIVRLATGAGGGNFWLAAIENDGNFPGTYYIRLVLITGGAIISDNALVTGLSLNNSTHTLKVTCSGNTFMVFLDGVQQGATITNATYNTAKACGPALVFGGAYPNVTLDNFLVETVPLVITTLTLPNGQVSSPYSQTITSQGGYQPLMTYGVIAGALPPGLSLSAGGVLSGTPTTAGVYPFTVQAADTLGDSATQMYTVTITGGSMSRLLVRPDAQQTPATRRFQQEVAQILNGLSYSGSIIISSGGIITIGGIAIGATVTGGTYTGGTGGDVLFVGVGGTLAQDNNFTFLETALGGPKLTLGGGAGLIDVPTGTIQAMGGLMECFSLIADGTATVGSGGLLLRNSFPMDTGFFTAVDDGALSGTAGYVDWGVLIPSPNFPAHLFETTTGGLVARSVVGILKSGTAPLLAGLADIVTATPFLFSIDQTGYFAGPGATFTSTSASAFIVTTGTNTLFQVDCSVGSAATGIKITGQAAASGARIAAISSGTNESLDLDPKGTSTVNVNTHAGAAANAGMNVTGSVTITSTATTAFTAGRQGATNAAFRVNANAATQLTGIVVTGQNTGGTGALIAVQSSATNEPLRIDAKGSGTIGIGLTSTGIITLGANTAITGTETITSTSASALAVGRQGATNPVLQVNANTASVITGVQVTGAASGGGVNLAAISTATDESITLDAKGAGTVNLGTNSSGNINLNDNVRVAGNLGATGTNPGLAILGSNTNDSAFTAFIGEYLPSLVASGGALGITAATAKNITSLTLTAGDWDVEGNVNFTTAAATFSGLQAGLSSTSATLPTDGSECYSGLVGTLLTDVDTITLPKKRFSLASTTTIYLVGYCNVISAGTVSGFGALTARRVR